MRLCGDPVPPVTASWSPAQVKPARPWTVTWPPLSWKQLMGGGRDQEWHVGEGLAVYGQRAEHHEVGRHLPVEEPFCKHSHHLLPYSDSGR
jgi:hypothetical protein